MKLSLKLLAGYFLIVGLAGFFVMRIFVAEVKPSVRVTIEENMVDMANLLAEFAAVEIRAVAASGGTRPPLSGGVFAKAVEDFSRREVDAKIWTHEKESLDLRVYVTDRRGIVIFDSAGKDLGKDYSAWRDVYLTLKGQYGARSTREVPGDDKTAIYHVAAPIREGKAIIGVLTVAKPISSFSPIIDEAEHNIVMKGAWLVISSLVIGLWVSSRLQRSVSRLVTYARAMAGGIKANKPHSSTRELQQLADAMADMRSKLDGKLYVERYVQALTHELKSPLTALQAHAELLADEVSHPGQETGDLHTAAQAPLPAASATSGAAHSAHRVLEQTRRLRSLVDQMLVLARLEGGALPTLERQDWRAILEPLLIQHQQALPERDLRLDVPAQAVWIRADAHLLHLACSNILQNAIDFSAASQPVLCSLREEGKGWVFSVRDHGPGFSELALSRLFERYFSTPRPDTGARSSGLGLALAREIVQVHHGRIEVENLSPGSRLSFILPAA